MDTPHIGLGIAQMYDRPSRYRVEWVSNHGAALGPLAFGRFASIVGATDGYPNLRAWFECWIRETEVNGLFHVERLDLPTIEDRYEWQADGSCDHEHPRG